jgi:para-nitrobenzyl esterase
MSAAWALALAAASSSAPVVRTEAGMIRGKATADGRSLFRGIPFAAPPVATLRWRAPQPVGHWPGIRDATRVAPACMQIDYGWNHAAAGRQSEDCLYLDVGTPTLKPARSLPVMVWIHGGGNRGGDAAGTIDSPLVREGVVLVSIQYRLSALGFLSHPALGARSGNYALMDQQAALRWVRQNVAAFGGDPNNVTIFGGSAGGQDVGLQLLSPGAKGLFARAIEQSGSPGFGVAARSLRENEALGEAIVSAAGAPSGATAATLRRLPAAALIEAADKAPVPGLDDQSFIWLEPVVDGTVLIDTPTRSLAAGVGAAIPLIIGTNSRELTLYGGAEGRDRAVARAFGEHAAAARAFYGLGTAHPAEDSRLGDTATQIADDINFRCPAIAVARERARVGGKTWHYQFDVDPAPGKPVAHSAEIGFVFGTASAATAPLARYWANFARAGDPNGPGLSPWPGYTRARPDSIVFGMDGATVQSDVRGTICGLRRVP